MQRPIPSVGYPTKQRFSTLPHRARQVTEMVSDVITWLLLFVVVTVSFSLSLAGFQAAAMYANIDEQKDFADFTHEQNVVNFDQYQANGALWSPFWAIFGEFSPGQYHWATAVLVWTYMIIGAVVLVNLLVAMFADTFARVKSDSQKE